MLLPGENYSEQLMFTLEAYKETWIDRRTAQLYGETLAALDQASNVAKEDAEKLARAKENVPVNFKEIGERALEIYDFAKKGTRFARVAAPLIVADGPLPFGDIIFAIALGIDLGIAAYNLVAD